MNHQTQAIVLSLLLHALLLGGAVGFAANAVQMKPPVLIELAIGATDGGDDLARPAKAEKKAAATPRKQVRPEVAKTRPTSPPRQVAAVRKENKPVEPAAKVTPQKTSEPAVQEMAQVESPAPSAASEPTANAPATVAATDAGDKAGAAGAPAGTSRNVGRDGRPVPAGALDGPLRAVAQNQPSYPPAARRQNIEGWIRVQYVVDERGTVGPVEVLAAEPEGFFEQSVLRCVRAWRFRPGTVDGVVVKALVEQTIAFRLR